MIRPAALACAAALWLTTAPALGEELDVRREAGQNLAERLGVIDRTDAALARTIARRHEHLELRVRAAYKLDRAGGARLWADPRERELAAWRRLISKRLIRRELAEIDDLTREREAIARARSALVRALGDVATAPIPAPGSLASPVAGELVAEFGRARDAETGARLTRRGVELATSPGAPARAVAAGQVIYAAPLRNLGDAAIVEHAGGLRSVVANLDGLEVATGDEVSRGDVLGHAAGDAIYLELRLPIGPEGYPIDPAPLLESL